MPGLGYDELKDHPIAMQGGYGGFTADQIAYYSDPTNFPNAHPQLKRILSNPDAMFEYTLQQPAVADSIRAYQNLQAQQIESQRRGLANQRAALGKQRAIAAEQRALEKKRLEYQLDSGLRDLGVAREQGTRDIGQAREQGLEAAINNALQRGIYRSGIRIENEAEVNREADEALGDLNTDLTNKETDLRSQIDLALQALALQGKMTNAQYDAQSQSLRDAAAGMVQQDAAWLTPNDLFTAVNSFTAGLPTNTPPTAPVYTPPKPRPGAGGSAMPTYRGGVY